MANNNFNEIQASSKAIQSLLSLDVSTQKDHESFNKSTIEDEAYNLINKLRELFGLDQQQIIQSRNTLEDLLESNGFYYRPSNISLDYGKYEQIPLVTINKKNGSLVIIHEIGSKTKIFDTTLNTYINGKKFEQEDDQTVYEIFPIFPENLDTFWELLKFSFPAVKRDFIFAALISVFVTGLSLLSPIITSRVVGDVVPSGNIGWIISTFIITVVIALYSSLMTWLQSFFLLRFTQKLSLRIQIPIYQRILSYPISFLDQYKIGDLSSRVTSVNSLLRSLSSSALSTVINIISLIGFMGLMINYDWQLSIFAIGLIITIAGIQTGIFRRQIVYEKSFVEEEANFYDETLQSLNNIAQIRTSGSERSIIERWSKSIFSFTSLRFNVNLLSSYNSIISSFLNNFGLSLIYAVLIYRLLNSSDINELGLQASTFIIFSSAFSSFSTKFTQLVDLFNTVLGQGWVDFKRAMPLIHQKQEEGLNTIKKQITLNGLIQFKDVTFSYPGSDNIILDKVSFTLYPNQFNVLFGPSGCGKSTIILIILGFYPIQSGSIFIDGHELSELDIKHLRSQMGTILQTTVLPVSSIKDALTSGLSESNETIWRTLELVNLSEEINALPMKLETILSEGAGNISGGQRQRLGIARALLREPKVLLEDESTSALDNYSQRVIVENLKNIGVSRIVVAHRITAIQSCDHIIVLQKGKIEFEGSFENSLVNSNYMKEVMQKYRSQGTEVD
ncbi:peptidase domain-containing ABC transporter [Synechococcus sp. A15-60]|uniref:peptidase domain-containing ABC transporter n=1 Tax=Synechococcus sp. A15-60 TaxID=1050655 RepID=UPI001647AF5C|nr:ATP-binding cassette domain-containing protein [Synechococcus sp. A15-60]QNI48054.1 ABC transporter family protein [Synechococcus sp. A15-60]